MITAISLNAALAEPVSILESEGTIEQDGAVRFSAPHVACKAVNAMRTVQALEPDRHRLLISLGRHIGGQLQEILEGEGMPLEVIPSGSENRRVLVLARRAGNSRWKFWEWKGARTMSGAEVDGIVAAVHGRFNESDTLVISGTPPQIPEGLSWIPLFQTLERSGARIVLDSSIWRQLADAGIRPWLLKMNRNEWGGHARGAKRLAAEVRRHREVWKVPAIVVTDGPRGACGVNAEGAWWALPGQVRDQNPIGCGDAFTGGLAVALSRGAEMPDALRLATACSLENLETHHPGGIENPERLSALKKGVEVKRMI